MQARTHLDYKTFLDEFWAVPTTSDDPLLRRHPAPNHYTLRAFRQTIAKVSERKTRTPGEYMVRQSPLHARVSRPAVLTTSTNQRWMVDKLKLCPKHSLCLDTTPPNAEPEWGHIEPIDDPRPAWARPQVLFLFVNDDSESPGPSELYRPEDVLLKVQHQFTVQQLTAVFVVVVGYDYVQPMRCDRSGRIISCPENYVRDPAVLPDLFWRLSVLTDVQLGLDPTASPVLPGTPDYDLMHTLAERHDDIDIPWEDGKDVPPMPKVTAGGDEPVEPQHWIHERSWFRTLLEPSEDSCDFERDKPFWRLTVPDDEDPDAPREFLIGMPLSHRQSEGTSIDERNTRVYIAYDCKRKTFVCLKDCWREVEAEGVALEREGQVLRKLNDAGVPYVPTLVCEADLPGQVTRTPEFWTKWDAFPDKEKPTKFRHYRMVTEEVCMELSEVKTSRLLVSIMHDCITGELLVFLVLHESAYTILTW